MRVRGLSALVLLAAVGAGCSATPQSVPDDYRRHVLKAGRVCPEVSARLIAAQIEQESGWDAGAVSRRGAQGLAQFMPDTWQAWGTDVDGDGEADPFDPPDAIDAQARLMCHLVERAQESGIKGDPVALALAAYNAGWGSVERYGGIPPFPETRDYVRLVRDSSRSIDLRKQG